MASTREMAVLPKLESSPEGVNLPAGASGLEDQVPADVAAAAAVAGAGAAAGAGVAAAGASAAAAAVAGGLGGGGGGVAAAASTTGLLPGFKAERTKVNVAEKHGARTSVVWRFFAKFFPALDDGKNVKCTLKRDDGTDCMAVYKHDNQANTGTGSMVRHLRRCKDESHKQAIQEFDAESKHSGAAKGARGAALSEAGKGADCLGRTARKPMAEDQTERLHKKYVTWCVTNGMPWKAVDDIAFKLIIAEWDPVIAAATPSFDTLDRVLREMHGIVKAELIEILDGAREDNKKNGYDGPFCSLQVDLVTQDDVEYMALSVQLIRSRTKTPTRYSLAMRSCLRGHAQLEIARWIGEVTVEYFGEGILPPDVFISASAVDPASSSYVVAEACESLGITTVLCRGQRLNSAVTRALGIDGTTGPACTNASMKGLVGKCSALLRLFSHSVVNNEGLRNQTADKKKEVEGLLLHADMLGMGMGAGEESDPGEPLSTSWSSTLEMMQKLATLMAPINDFLLLHPDMGHLGLTREEWVIATEVCGVLELFKYVSTAIDSDVDGFVGRAIFLCNTLLDLLGDDTTMIIDRGVAGASPGHKAIADLHPTTGKFIAVAIDELKRSKVNIPELEVELVGMFLDPRYKRLDRDDSGGGDHKERLTAALAKVRDAMTDLNTTTTASSSPLTPADAAPAAANANATPGKRHAEVDADPFAEYSRKRRKRAAAAAAEAAASCTLASRFDKEIAEYKLLPEVVGGKFDLLSFWDDAARPRLDEDGFVRALPKFPILAMLARVFHSADTTSCGPARDISAAACGMGNLQRSMLRDRVNMMAFLKLNQGMIPEVRSYTRKLAEMQKVQSDGFDKAVMAQADGAGEEFVVVQ